MGIKVSYYNEDYDLIAETNDFVTAIGDLISINDIDYKVVDRKIDVENSETKFSIWVE